MWNYIETFYHEQGEEDSGYVTEAYLQNLARQVAGLNTLAVGDRPQRTPNRQPASKPTRRRRTTQGFNGTPSFLIGHTGGALKKLEYTSLEDPSGFNEAIEKQLQG